jgi:ribose-phosphate pyrophosphokinase
MPSHPLHIFSGSRFVQLAQEITSELDLQLGNATSTFLPDSEIHVILNEVVREHDVFFIQSIARPVNDAIIELLLYLDAFRRASTHKINVIIPYFPYARQERMSKGRESISARVIANLIEQQGASRVIFIDIHNPAIQGFFNIPVDPISAIPILCNHLSKSDLSNAIIVSPDVGRASLAGKYAERLKLPRIERVVVTNTLPLPERAKQCKKIEQVTIAPLLSEIIRRIYNGESILNQLVLS